MRVYCDTNTLLHNMTGKPFDRQDNVELAALKKLLKLRNDGKLLMFRSRVNLTEIGATKDQIQRNKLLSDYETLDQIPLDEKVVSFHNAMDRYGGASYPLVSDYQDEKLYNKVRDQITVRLGRGNSREEQQRDRDAHHLTQAISNKCDAFLTRDRKSIIDPLAEYLRREYDGVAILLSSELLARINSASSK